MIRFVTMKILKSKKKMDYTKAIPYKKRIVKINKLYDDNHKIVYWTARGTVTQKLWFDITIILIPIGGSGQRFKDNGYTKQKKFNFKRIYIF